MKLLYVVSFEVYLFFNYNSYPSNVNWPKLGVYLILAMYLTKFPYLLKKIVASLTKPPHL